MLSTQPRAFLLCPKMRTPGLVQPSGWESHCKPKDILTIISGDITQQNSPHWGPGQLELLALYATEDYWDFYEKAGDCERPPTPPGPAKPTRIGMLLLATPSQRIKSTPGNLRHDRLLQLPEGTHGGGTAESCSRCHQIFNKAQLSKSN